LLPLDHQARPHVGSLSAMAEQPERTEFLTETERGLRAAVLGTILGLVLALFGRRR